MSKYGDELDAMDQSQQQQAATVSNVASQFNPDQYAQALTRTEGTGVPAATIARLPADAMPSRSKYGAALDEQDAPITQQWMSDLDNAAVAQDDVENLSYMERILVSLGGAVGVDASSVKPLSRVAERLPGNTYDTLRASLVQGAAGLGEYWQESQSKMFRQYADRAKSGYSILPDAIAKRQAERDALSAQKANASASEFKGVAHEANLAVDESIPSDAGVLERAFQSGVSSVGQSVPGFLLAGPAGGAVIMGAESFGSRYAQLRDLGIDENTSTNSATLMAGIEIATEYLPGKALVKDVPGIWKHIAEFMVAELPGENIASLSQLMDDYRVGIRDDVTVSDVLTTIRDTSLATIVGGATQVSASHIIQHLAEKTNETSRSETQSANAEAGKQAAEELHTIAQQSKLAARSPQKLEELVSKIKEETGSDHAYVDAEAFRTLFQSDQEAASVAKELTGSANTYYEAAVSGSRMAIPLEKYVSKIAANKKAQSLLDHVTFSPDGATVADAKEITKSINDRAAELEKQAPEAKPDSSQAIYEDVLTQLESTGMERATAEKNASLTQSVFRSLGQRTRVDAQELFNRYGLKVQRQELSGVSGFDQSQQDDRDLVITHNISAEKLLHANKLGGLAVPSLAITKADAPLEGFGDIVLVGDAAMADPKGYAGTKVFGADIYSPRYPTIEFKLSSPSLKHINAELASFRKEGDRELYSGEITKAEDLVSYKPFQRYAEEKLGKTENSGGYHELASEAVQLLSDSGADERIFQGYTNSGNRRYIPHTLENVVKLLKKELRGGESFNYGVGSLRAHFTPQFRSLSQIKKEKGRLISQKEMEAVKEEINNEFFKVADSLAKFYKHDAKRFGFSDIVISVMTDAAKMGLPRSLKENQFNEVDADTLKSVAEFLEKLRHLPTGYFEAKITRDVDLSEFRAALVPIGTSQKVIDVLEKSGIHWQHYDKDSSDPTDKQYQLKSLLNEVEARGKKVLFQRFDETKRGAIQFGADRQFTISLLEKADLSTFLHESGHFYLEIIGDLAEDASAPQQVKDDFASILKWMGVNSRADIGIDQHEQWARGFESYLMEGKAPSVELQSVFARFRAWLVAVYRTVSRLNVNLTDDVRRVMDRLVATDDEIAGAEASQNYAPIFTSAEQAGMSPEQWAVYRDIATRAHQEATQELTDRAMRELSREQKAWWKEERAKMADAVTTEVNEQPTYKALAFLQKGLNPDGTALSEGVQPAKLDKAALVERYGKDFLKRLPRGTAAKEGLSADLIGQMFGFDSGDALVEALANARPKAQLIEMEADARMREKYGDMLTDGSLAEQAMKSVHSEGRAKVMAAELKALNRQRRAVHKFVRANEKQADREQRQAREANESTLPDADELKAIKLAASRAIVSKKVRDIQPNLYRMAEAKAARKAFEFAGKNDFEKAYIEKRRQILNHELYRAAVSAREEVDSIVDFMRSFDRKPTRERLAKAKGQYLEQIDALRERFDFSNVSNIADLQRTALVQWAAEQEAAGREVNIPEALLNEARRTPYKELLLAELQGLHDAVKNIDHLARTKDRMLKNRAEAQWQDAKQDLSERLDGQGGKAPPVSKFERTKFEEYGAIAHEMVDSWLRPETIVEWLDGGESGPWHDYLMEPANNAEYKREALREQVLKPLVNLAEKVTKHRRNELHEDIQIKALGQSFNRRTLLSIVLNMGNESNLERLSKGGFRDGSTIRQFTPEALKEILSKLNATDIQFLNTAWSTVEQLWPEVVEFQKRMGGLVPEKIKPIPFKAPAGELTGGYWPVVYDSLATRAGQKQAESSDPIQTIMGANFTRASTKKGHTKGRTAVAGPLLLDYAAVAGRHTEQVITDLTHREYALQAMKILDDGDLRLKLQDAMGETAWQSLRGMVRHAIEQDGGYSEAANRGQEKIMRRLLSNTAVAALGFRAVTAWGNMVLAPIQAGARITPKYIAIGLGKFYRHPIDATKFIHDSSEMMRQRSKNMDHTFNVVMDTLKGQRGFRAKVAQASMAVHSTADHLATHGLWLGRYQEALDAGSDHDEAVRLADKSIRQTQTAGAPKDLSAFERDPKYTWFKMFLGPMLIQGNRIRESLGRRGVVKNWPQAFGTMMAAWFLPAVMWDLISGRGPDDKEDDGIADDAASWSLQKIFFYPFMTMPFIRDAASLAERKMSGQYAEPRMTPLADAVLMAMKAGSVAYKETADWMDGGDFEAEKVFRSTLRSSGPLLGLPTNQIDVTTSYMWDLYTGDAEMENVGDLRYLLIRP